jgi:hypothetical protein
VLKEAEAGSLTGGVECRLNMLRRRIALCREHLRQGFDPEFAAVYVREIAEAQRELADLLERSGLVR